MKRRDEQLVKYESEAAMCLQFADYATARGWIVYPETAGWDMLLVRQVDGYQLGIQAKLQANLDVLEQTIRSDGYWYSTGPDFRAVLVPYYAGKAEQLKAFCPYIGTTLISARPGNVDRQGMVATGYGRSWAFQPELPTVDDRFGVDRGSTWFELCPSKRLTLPAYVPDVRPGSPAPLQLTNWKIGAIKIAILLERRGHITRADFKHLQIDHRRWIASGPSSILVADPPNGFRAPDKSTPGLGFKKEHPRNYKEIAADFDKWAPPASAVQDKLI